MKIIDISPTISEKIAVFPGDCPFKKVKGLDFQKGDHLTLSSMTSTLHLGAHTDAPVHYHSQGQGMEERSLSYYLGTCQVITVTKSRGELITLQDLSSTPLQAKRLLFRTLSFPDPHCWNDDFVAFSAELINFLAKQKVKLVGIDTPSIDPAHSKDLPAHQMIFQHDMAILEGVILEHVSDGLYSLMALPLKIKGADASPVRAVLVSPALQGLES